MRRFCLFAALMLSACGPQGLSVKASDFTLSGSGTCEGELEVTYRDAITVGLEGGAGVGGELAETWWSSCEYVAVSFSGARWVLVAEEQGPGECAERAGEMVFEAPPEEAAAEP